MTRKTGFDMPMDLSLTPHQHLVWNALLLEGRPMGAYALLERLQGEKLKAPLQIYRALDKLVEFGLVHRLESLNAFVACSHGHGCHRPSAFAICDKCGHVEEFADESIGSGLARWSEQNAFKPEKVTVELRGLCTDCQEKPN